MAISHVSELTPLLQVFDMRQSIAFYRDLLGFELVQTHEPDGHLYWALLKLGGATLMLNARYEDCDRPPAREPASGREDFTLYFLCRDVDETYADLHGQLLLEPPRTMDYGMRQLTIRDPDGFVLCFQHPAE